MLLLGVGSVAPGLEPPRAFELASGLARSLGEIRGRSHTDILRVAWERLASIEHGRFGPSDGQDLSLLLMAQDPYGIGVTGTGLAGVWARNGERFDALVSQDHPLLSLRGIPEQAPGFFALQGSPTALIGAASSGSRELPTNASYLLACGVRDV